MDFPSILDGFKETSSEKDKETPSILTGMERMEAPKFDPSFGYKPAKAEPDPVANLVLDMIPGAKYLLPENREEFNSLTPEEKGHSIAWDVLGAALFVAGGPLLVKGGRALSGVIRTGAERAFPSMAGRLAKIAAREQPIEDVLVGLSKDASKSFTPFNVEEAAAKALRNEWKGLKSEEVSSIVKARYTGNNAELKNAVLERSFKGKEMSPQWKANVSSTGEPYGGFKLGTSLEASLSEERLRAIHYADQYKKVFSQEVLHTREKDISEDLFHRVYGQQMEARYPTPAGEVAGHKLENITEGDFATFHYGYA